MPLMDQKPNEFNDLYKNQYLQSQKPIEIYESQQNNSQKTNRFLLLLLILFGFAAIGYLFVFQNPNSDLVIPSPTSTPYPSRFYSTIGKAIEAKSASIKTEIYVWIPRSGKRYHDSQRCSGMKDPKYVTLSEAKRLGYTACGTCNPPY